MKTSNHFLRVKFALYISIRLFTMSMAIMSITLMSCSKDDKDEKPDITDYSGHPIVGTWFMGSISGGRYNSVTGRYEGATGSGIIYYFKSDGTFSEMIVSSNLTYTWAASISGKYTLKNDIIKFTKQVSEDSSDNGETWGKKKSLPDVSNYFAFGTDVLGDYMLIGLDDATPPLDPETNAAKYRCAN